MTADALLPWVIPVISHRPDKPFSILSVMHHGTHEKQLSNLWAWLLDVNGSHRLGDLVQRIFIDEVNRVGDLEDPVPYGPYGVRQEQNTSEAGESMDIADIVLEDGDTAIVIENYYTSDGHGHGYARYKAFGERDNRRSVVVLLCETEVRSRLTNGWENAPVVVYTRLLDHLLPNVIATDYATSNPEQAHFITNVQRHYTKKARVDHSKLIDLVDALCRSGEAERYGFKDQDRQAILLGDSLRESAIQQYTESREMLAKAKQRLRDFCLGTLIPSVNDSLGVQRFEGVQSNWQGRWLYDVSLLAPDDGWLVSIALGPTFAAQLEEAHGGVQVSNLNASPDFTKLLVHTRDKRGLMSDVGIAEVLSGLPSNDRRLHDEVLQLLQP